MSAKQREEPLRQSHISEFTDAPEVLAELVRSFMPSAGGERPVSSRTWSRLLSSTARSGASRTCAPADRGVGKREPRHDPRGLSTATPVLPRARDVGGREVTFHKSQGTASPGSAAVCCPSIRRAAVDSPKGKFKSIVASRENKASTAGAER